MSHNRAAEEMFPELGEVKSFPASGKVVLEAYPELFMRIAEAEGRDERFPFRLLRVTV